MAVLKNSDSKMNSQKDKKVYLVAQELKLTRVLAGNNKSAREKALRNLPKWFAKRTETMPFTEDDFQRIWKGLFYAMWMSDKPLVQEECAENIANLIHLPSVDTSLLFFKAGLTILNNEWNGIDQLRLDKFLMLVRRLLRQAFFVLKKHFFSHKDIENFNAVLSSTILMPHGLPALGLLMHFIEIFMEELAKVSEGRIHQEKVCVFLKPFIEKLVTTDDDRLIAHIRKFIFTYLIRQSNLGFEYQAKYEAWKQQGFPGSIDSMQKIPLNDEEKMTEDDDEEAEESSKPLDPRAGRVDVEIPQLKFSAKTIASNLIKHKYDKNGTTKARNMINVLSKQFNKLANGEYPLGVKKVLNTKNDHYDTNIRKAANRLIKFEQKLMGKDRKRKRQRTANDQEEEVTIKRSKKENRTLKNSNDKTDEKNKKSNNGALHRETKTKQDFEKFSLDEDVEIKIKDKSKILKMKEMAKKHSKKQTRKRKDTKEQSIVDNIECVFERNSGTWVVFDVTDCDSSEKIPTLQQSSTAELKKVDKVVEAPSLQSKKLNGNVADKSLVPLHEKRKLRSKSTVLQTRSAKQEIQPVAEQPTIEGAEIHSG
ncbi:unnamed protein product [Callosobruchus maculatus]|uniref:Ribosomal RNA processing protein 1 homolog n=1 Tax=Callosobruchus maculatus TaxID=64391 RepID=A0A653DNK1_CALMS|nr:unnamed protein product [Callosobruchus maculatus]